MNNFQQVSPWQDLCRSQEDFLFAPQRHRNCITRTFGQFQQNIKTQLSAAKNLRHQRRYLQYGPSKNENCFRFSEIQRRMRIKEKLKQKCIEKCSVSLLPELSLYKAKALSKYLLQHKMVSVQKKIKKEKEDQNGEQKYNMKECKFWNKNKEIGIKKYNLFKNQYLKD